MALTGEFSIVIRASTEADIEGVKEVFRDGAFSNILPAFKLDVRKRPFHYFIVVALAFVTAVYQASVGLLDVVLTVLFCLCVLLAFEVSAAVLYVYGPHSYSADVIKASKLKETYLNDHDTCFWVAEAVRHDINYKEIVGTIAITHKRNDAVSPPGGHQKQMPPGGHQLRNRGSGDESRKIAWLRRMVVKTSFRRMGIAKRLVLTAVDFCASHHYDQIELLTTDIHAAAKKLYELVGFECISHKPHGYFHGYLKVWMYEYVYYCQSKNTAKLRQWEQKKDHGCFRPTA